MNLKKINRSFLLLTAFIILSSCGKTNRYEKLSKDEQSLSWQGERKRSFGNSDYSKIASEAEAFTLIEEKYKLEIPVYYKETKKLLEKELSSKTVKQGETRYSVFAQNKELLFRTVYTFYTEKELKVFAEVIFNYGYSVEQELAYLKAQTISIKVPSAKGKLSNDNVSELVQKLGKNMKVSDEKINAGLAGYEKKVMEATSPITDDFLPILESARGYDEKEFTKIIAVGYDVDGTLRELYTEISE